MRKLRDWTTAMLVEGHRAELLKAVETTKRQELRRLLSTPSDGDRVDLETLLKEE